MVDGKLSRNQKCQVRHLLKIVIKDFPWAGYLTAQRYNLRSQTQPKFQLDGKFLSDGYTACIVSQAPDKATISVSREFFAHSEVDQAAILAHELGHHWQYLRDGSDENLFQMWITPPLSYVNLGVLLISCILTIHASYWFLICVLTVVFWMLYLHSLHREMEFEATYFGAVFWNWPLTLAFVRRQIHLERYAWWKWWEWWERIWSTHPTYSSIERKLMALSSKQNEKVKFCFKYF